MEPEVALRNLNEAAGQFQGNRQQHELLSKSAERLREIIVEWHELKAKVAKPETPEKAESNG